ncbi:sarcosine dehydrogenase, mitochondrial [Lontra canadensis]|uniref:sarcosine dehydrogenase, mitochondrial n=1 Tax=Lontra canadensis TaxID=76717 RepID=UPI0013F381DE|nr:sarcosine dehydrogenase, mitochondrial [Lontra canadensis]
MASLSRALRVATTCSRRALGPRALASRAGPTTEKSVPYQRTLKEAQGPTAVAQGPSRPLPSTANVVVIGGGSLGCQTLYHLAKLGVSGAVLLERERLTSGTTWHTAGLLWQLRPSDVEVELLAHTRRVVSRDLEEETGLHTGWIQNGGLFVASNRQRLDEYKRLMSLGKAYGVESHVLSPAETKALYPLMNVDDLYGTLYVPQDGTMDPAGTCTALSRAAAAQGAQVIENCPVSGIRVRTDDFGVRRVAAVETAHGSIQTPCVVNCAGVWASAVGRMAGVKVPLVAMHHAYVVTERIEGIQRSVTENFLRAPSNDPSLQTFLFQFYRGAGQLGHSGGGGICQVIPFEEAHLRALTASLLRGTLQIKKECLACRGAAAVFNMSYFGKFYLVGLDARKAADWLFSADVNRPPGSTVYTCMLNHRGGTESDLTVSRLAPSSQASALAPAFEGDGYYLAVGGAVAQHNWAHIRTVLQDQRFRCQLIDGSEDLGLISIQGPASRAILQEVLDADLSNEAFPFSTHKLVRAAGHLVRAMRLSFVGELGWELHVPRPACVPVYQAVMTTGAKHGLVNAGYRAIDSLSIEKGYRHWHADLRPDDSPLEAGLAFTCKLKSAVPFLGRAALEQQRAEGLRRRLLCLTVDEKVPMFGLEAIWRNGQVVGHIRRADFGFAIDKTIAYGYIRDPSGGPVSLDFVKSGEYAVERMGATCPARAHLKSPFDPDNKRVKGIY